MADMEELKIQLAALTRRLDELEDVQAIRRLHHAYGYYIDYNRADEVSELFSDDAEIVFLSGIYRGKEGAKRLYGTWFQNHFTEGKPGPVYGLLLDHFQMQDIITVAERRDTAKGRLRGLLFGGNHVLRKYKPENLPKQFMEAGVYDNEYVREDGVWKIRRLDYVVQWQAAYEKGWARDTVHLQPATKTFPEDPLGPDELLPTAETRAMWPDRSEVKMHYAHPVLAKALRE